MVAALLENDKKANTKTGHRFNGGGDRLTRVVVQHRKIKWVTVCAAALWGDLAVGASEDSLHLDTVAVLWAKVLGSRRTGNYV